MDEYDVAMLLMQAEAEDVGAVFRDWMRGMARRTVLRVFEAEMQALCGALYRPEEGSPCYRAGSAPGKILHEGRKEDVRRPRVRRCKEDGKTEEVRLSSYEAAQEPGHLQEMLLRALCAGVSTRGQKGVYGRDFDQVKAFFGADKKLSAILAPHVGKFLKSDALLKLPNGGDRAKPTVDKTIRVFRMFLVWAKDTGRIDKLPLPKDLPLGRSATKETANDDEPEHNAVDAPADA